MRLCLLACAVLIAAIPCRADEPLPVVASFSILGDITARIGGDRIAVTTLVGPDGDAHVFEPGPRDLRAVAGARVLVVNGLGFEGWICLLYTSDAAEQDVQKIDVAAAQGDDHDAESERDQVEAGKRGVLAQDRGARDQPG